MTQTNPGGWIHACTHMTQAKVVTAMSCSPQGGLDKNIYAFSFFPYKGECV